MQLLNDAMYSRGFFNQIQYGFHLRILYLCLPRFVLKNPAEERCGKACFFHVLSITTFMNSTKDKRRGINTIPIPQFNAYKVSINGTPSITIGIYLGISFATILG